MENTIALGFNTSLVEIGIFAVILVSSVVFWISVSLRRNRRESEDRLHWAEEYYLKLVEQLNLGPSERELLDQLAATVEDPRERFLILRDQRTFNNAVGRLLEDAEGQALASGVSQGAVTALRMHIGFSGTPTGLSPHSTAELPAGSAVLVRLRSGSPIPARVHSHTATSLILEVDGEAEEGGTLLPSGRAVQLLYRNAAGEFFFGSTVFRHADSRLELSHSERVQRRQRRRQYRRGVELKVRVIPLEKPETDILTTIVELGGNGATLVNKKEQFAPGNELDLTFEGADQRELSVIARVVRTSRENTLAHVQFVTLREYDRDRIYRLLFS